MVIVQIGCDESLAVTFVEHDIMFEKLSTTRADHSFEIGVLPQDEKNE